MATVSLNKELVAKLRELVSSHKGLSDFIDKHPDGLVIMDSESFHDMRDDQDFLNCLVGAGVDNWGGYEYAVEDFQAMKEED